MCPSTMDCFFTFGLLVGLGFALALFVLVRTKVVSKVRSLKGPVQLVAVKLQPSQAGQAAQLRRYLPGQLVVLRVNVVTHPLLLAYTPDHEATEWSLSQLSFRRQLSPSVVLYNSTNASRSPVQSLLTPTLTAESAGAGVLVDAGMATGVAVGGCVGAGDLVGAVVGPGAAIGAAVGTGVAVGAAVGTGVAVGADARVLAG